VVGPTTVNFILMKPSCPKTDNKINGTPMRSCEGVAKKHEIHNTDLQTTRIGGETLPEPLWVAPSTPSTPYLSAP
jgi:hypothetical protein